MTAVESITNELNDLRQHAARLEQALAILQGGAPVAMPVAAPPAAPPLRIHQPEPTPGKALPPRQQSGGGNASVEKILAALQSDALTMKQLITATGLAGITIRTKLTENPHLFIQVNPTNRLSPWRLIPPPPS